MKKKKAKKIDISYYIVGFLDLLGQQERLRSLRDLPDESDKAQMEKFIIDLKGTYGVVKEMRRMFENFFLKFSVRKSDISKLTPEQRKTHRLLNNNPIQIKSFSDAIIVSVSLNTKELKLPTRGIFGIFVAAASTALVSLSVGHPIRGGIDIGLGMEIQKGEIYGPSLSRAYSLESKIAGYPRIVVGKEFVDYLQFTARKKPEDIYEEIGAATAKDCLKLLTIDDDGCAIIDFLSEYFFSAVGFQINTDIVDKAFENVIIFSEHFKKANNTKLAFRYTLLRSYMEHRLNSSFFKKRRSHNNMS